MTFIFVVRVFEKLAQRCNLCPELERKVSCTLSLLDCLPLNFTSMRLYFLFFITVTLEFCTYSYSLSTFVVLVFRILVLVFRVFLRLALRAADISPRPPEKTADVYRWDKRGKNLWDLTGAREIMKDSSIYGLTFPAARKFVDKRSLVPHESLVSSSSSVWSVPAAIKTRSNKWRGSSVKWEVLVRCDTVISFLPSPGSLYFAALI